MSSRKDQAKLNYLNSEEGRALRRSVVRHNVPVDQIADTVLPDDFEFDGWKVLDGKFYKTAGEYKAACKKKWG